MHSSAANPPRARQLCPGQRPADTLVGPELRSVHNQSRLPLARLIRYSSVSTDCSVPAT